MNRRTLAIASIAAASFLTTAHGGARAAQPADTAKAAPRDAPALLKAAQDAAAALKSITYDSSVTTEGAPGSVTAQIAARGMDAGGWAFRVRGHLQPAPKAGETAVPEKEPLEIVYDGVTARSLREAKKEVCELSAIELEEVRLFFFQENAGKPVAWELFESPAYATATKDATLALDGTAVIDGAPCNILKVTGPADAGGGANVIRYFLGGSDSLPRRIERWRVAPDGGAPQRQVLVISSLKSEALGAGGFVMSVPDGFRVVASQTRKGEAAARAVRPPRLRETAEPEAEDGLLEVGAPAPGWTLRDGDGTERRLSQYRGKVVVLDFWGTWCPWCVKAMPALQKVHEKFQGRPVVVLGMNHEGNPEADPIAFMKKNGFTYGLIREAGSIAQAYKVSGWPTLYVIGADGRVLFAKGGFSAELENEVSAAIERGLEDTGL